MTAEREEIKFLIAADQVQRFTQAMNHRLPHHRFVGEGANLLPRPHHFVTTIYFDTPSRHQYRSSRMSCERNLKMRAKDYYDVHPCLVELATDSRQSVKSQPLLWLELKFKEGTKTGKRRMGIPKRDIPAFFGQGFVTSETIDVRRTLYGSEDAAVLRAIAEYCGRFDEPFRADCLVNYRRLPWQGREGNLRVTLDVGLEFYEVPADLWTRRSRALLRESLGRPKGRQPNAVLEVKARGHLPDWLRDLLANVGASQTGYSKFEEASRAVHG